MQSFIIWALSASLILVYPILLFLLLQIGKPVAEHFSDFYPALRVRNAHRPLHPPPRAERAHDPGLQRVDAQAQEAPGGLVGRDDLGLVPRRGELQLRRKQRRREGQARIEPR